MTLRDALGEDRWVEIQRSSIKEQIRNCSLSEVTIGEVKLMTDLFCVPVRNLVTWFLTDSEKKEFIPDSLDWFEGLEDLPHNMDEALQRIPKRY